MPFLPPNQQRQSTEGKNKEYINESMSEYFIYEHRYNSVKQ